MRFVSAAVLAVVACLSGCTTNRPLPDATRAGSLIDYVQALRRETSTLLDTVVVSMTTPTQDLPEYRAWGDHWCPRHQEVHSTEDVARKVGEYCSRLGGTFQEPYCTQTAAPDRVLFFAKFQRGIDLCQAVAATVSVEVVEPKPGMVQSAGYLNRLRTYGYRTGGDLAQAAISAQQVAAAEKSRVARELPLLRTRGTRVCQKQNGVIFLGFVEDSSEAKIKISVQEAYYSPGPGKELGMRNPNYRAETIWDQPDRWYVCE